MRRKGKESVKEKREKRTRERVLFFYTHTDTQEMRKPMAANC